MRDGGRIAAAVEVLAAIEARHRPAHLALKGWGADARYAGAKDRAFVSGLVLDVLRRRRSLAWMMGEETDRARSLGAVRFVWDWPIERIEAAAAEQHGPGELTKNRAAAPSPSLSRWTMRRRRSSATTRTGSMALWSAYSAMHGLWKARRWRLARRSTCASTA